MNSKEIRELMAQVESTEVPINLRPSDTDREAIRAQRQLTLAVLEVALQLATLQEDRLQGIEGALRRQ
jgi:DNA-binding transcriptional MerR regulator